jgi:hypothetical protein
VAIAKANSTNKNWYHKSNSRISELKKENTVGLSPINFSKGIEPLKLGAPPRL